MSASARFMRCFVLFFTVALLGVVGRQLARAAAAALAGIPITVHQFFVLVGRVASSRSEYAAINLAPSVFSLVLGLTGGFVYGRSRSAGMRLFALYLAAAGTIGLFSDGLGSLTGGDLTDTADGYGLPTAFLLASSLAIVVLSCLVLWWIGARLQPPLRMVAGPWLLSATLLPLAYAPLPWPAAYAIWAGQAQWLIVIASAAWHHRTHTGADPLLNDTLRLSSTAWALPILLLTIVRAMTVGFQWGP